MFTSQGKLLIIITIIITEILIISCDNSSKQKLPNLLDQNKIDNTIPEHSENTNSILKPDEKSKEKNDVKNIPSKPLVVNDEKENEKSSKIDDEDKNLTLNTEAVVRGFYVFVGLSIIVMIYIAFRTIRVNRQPTSSTTVRKYGVVGRRGDLEMTPLPLAEDDDDDTLFDATRANQTTT